MKYQNQERAQCKESKGDIGREERQGYRWSQTLSTPWDYQQPTNAKIIMITNKRENMFCVDFGIISNGALYNNVLVLKVTNIATIGMLSRSLSDCQSLNPPLS